MTATAPIPPEPTLVREETIKADGRRLVLYVFVPATPDAADAPPAESVRHVGTSLESPAG
ncbi:MAG: hypothetical protein SNJ67_08435 [Chloracidobacterium sp.]|uniref:Uncharacterized protein n=1 Tax=Chloracidobacterium validum TaxID=2821543 RepID=A0ABX8BFA4_9BACT|nr:hypothetical protein [Chloracidobacterium validum]QUW04671.1 hypothetical protein J8C06_12935 [Chloracidobacterium validum]